MSFVVHLEPSGGGTSGDDNNVEFIGEMRNGASTSTSSTATATTSTTATGTSPKERQLLFNIHHDYQSQRIVISDRATLGKTLK